jgi:magnesium-dependent phosphatase 1
MPLLVTLSYLILITFSCLMSASSLRLVAFDLDGTMWNPEMYEVYRHSGQWKATADPNVCTDAGGTEVKLLGVTGQAFDYLKDNNIKIAIVSCTDEPIWAKELLKLFKTPKGNQ